MAHKGSKPLDVQSQGALAKYLLTFREPLRRYFSRCRTPPCDVEDLVQEVFLRVARRGEPQAIEAPSAYLFATAASVLKDAARKRRVRPVESELGDSVANIAGEDIAADRVLEGREKLESVIVALEELPQKTRSVIVLQRFENRSYNEIAALMGISVSAVEKHMMKGIAFLARRISELGHDR